MRRLTSNALPATAVVLPNQPGFDWGRVRRMPEVESLTTFLLGATEIQVVDDATGETLSNAGIGFPPGDDAWGRTIERPVLQEGRLIDAGRADEVLATPGFMRHFHKRLGDTLTAHLFTVQQVRDQAGLSSDAPEPAGPQVGLRIVGVGMAPWGHDSPAEDGGLMLLARIHHSVPGELLQRQGRLRQRAGPAARRCRGPPGVPGAPRPGDRTAGHRRLEPSGPDSTRSSGTSPSRTAVCWPSPAPR